MHFKEEVSPFRSRGFRRSLWLLRVDFEFGVYPQSGPRLELNPNFSLQGDFKCVEYSF